MQSVFVMDSVCVLCEVRRNEAQETTEDLLNISTFTIQVQNTGYLALYGIRTGELISRSLRQKYKRENSIRNIAKPESPHSLRFLGHKHRIYFSHVYIHCS